VPIQQLSPCTLVSSRHDKVASAHSWNDRVIHFQLSAKPLPIFASTLKTHFHDIVLHNANNTMVNMPKPAAPAHISNLKCLLSVAVLAVDAPPFTAAFPTVGAVFVLCSNSSSSTTVCSDTTGCCRNSERVVSMMLLCDSNFRHRVLCFNCCMLLHNDFLWVSLHVARPFLP